MKRFLHPEDVVPWSCVALAALLGWLTGFGAGSSGMSFWQVLPWVFGALLFGLPHGACDHLVAARLFGRSSRRNLPVFVLLYLVAAAAVVALWVFSSLLALGLFLILTAWHWGSADAMNTEEPLRPGRYLTASLARGVLVVSAPVVFHPQESLTAFGWLTGVFDGFPSAGSTLQLPGTSLAILTVLFGVSLVTEFLLGLRALPDVRRAARCAAEICLLVGLFYFVAPVAAVGVYFVCWHAWRHVVRVGRTLQTGKRSESASAELIETVVDYHRKALPLTAVSLTGVVFLYLIVGASGPESLFGAYLVAISALTLPHAVLVFFLDRHELAGSSY